MSDRLIILDTTLRDGEQAPGVKQGKDVEVGVVVMQVVDDGIEDVPVDLAVTGYANGSPPTL